MEWTISADLISATKLTDEDLEQLVDLLADHSASIGLSEDRYRWHAVFTLETEDVTAGAAALAGQAVLAELVPAGPTQPGARVIAIEAMTVDEHDRRLSESTFPELLGIGEIAELLGVSRQRASTLQTSAAFPAPVARLKSGPIWTEPSVRNFAATWERRGGRPRKAPETIHGKGTVFGGEAKTAAEAGDETMAEHA
jgi:hypothetical protein